MMGSTHRAIGIFTGIMLALCGVIHRETLWVLMLLTAPFGAMLPDIDHNNSKLGRKRKQVLSSSKKAVYFVSAGAVVVFIVAESKGVGLSSAVKEVALILMGITILLLLTCVPQIREKFKFFMKHRGIMHTLVVPVVLVLLCVYVIRQDAIRFLVIGLAAGYFTHLVADCLTKEGCPILWPLTEQNINILKVTTGTKAEKAAAFVLCLFIAVACWICSGYLL